MGLQRRFIFVLFVYEKHARILTRLLHEIGNASRLAARLFLELAKEFDHLSLMSGVDRYVYCQNEHSTSFLMRCVSNPKACACPSPDRADVAFAIGLRR